MKRFIRIFLWTVLIVLVSALRFYHLSTMNPYIEDLSARQALLTLDFHNGIHHFPYAPYLLEFDETGSAYVVYAWTLLFGDRWISFQAYAAFMGVVLAVGATLFTFLRFGRLAACFTGIFVSTNPALLTWDRYPIYAGSHLLTLVTLLSWWFATSRSVRLRSTLNWIASGMALGLGLYVTNLVNLALPSAAICMIMGTGADSIVARIREIVRRVTLFVGGMATVSIPILLNGSQLRRYLTWRLKHFEDFRAHVDPLEWVFRETSVILSQLAINASNCLFQAPGFPMINHLVLILTIAGMIAALVLKKRTEYLVIPMYFVMWLGLIAFVETGSWRCSYFSLILPFLMIQAGAGGAWILEHIVDQSKRTVIRRSVIGMGILCAFIFGFWDSRSFLTGPQKPVPGNALLTDLHYDLEQAPDIPHIFTVGVHEAFHYHFPFWYATRSNVSRVSIAEWDAEGWFTHPDRIRIRMNRADEITCRIVLDPADFEEFNRIASELIAAPAVRLDRSGLWAVPCAVTIPIELTRTWTDSVVPVILEIKSQ